MEAMKPNLLNKYSVFSLTVFTVLLLDQLSKAYINSAMRIHESWVVIEGFLNLTHVRNPGAAFGFLARTSPIFRSFFFVLISLLAIGLILHYLVKSREHQPWLFFALSLVLGGALGNLIDRLRFGEVVDFIDIYWTKYHWPAFNVADSAISAGAVILILVVLRHRTEDSAEA